MGIVLFTTILGAVTVGTVVQGLILAALFVVGIALRPKIPPVTANTLNSTLDPAAYRVTVLGNAPCGNDIRYWEVYGATRIDQVIAAATHPITAWGDMFINGMLITFSGVNAEGTAAQGTSGFPNYVPANTSLFNPSGAGGSLLRVYYNSKGTAGNKQFPAVAVGNGGLYSNTASFTGCASYLLKWNADPRFLTQGIPSQICQVVAGSPIYDPRRDSTVGGSGTHRANDNSTWEYSPLDSNSQPIGRNNALQMLRYLLGWFIINPVTSVAVQVDGRGVNPADINMANFIAAANICETEGYYSDVALSTGDSHTQNEATIAAGAQGILLDTGGMWSYQPAVDDTASIAVALTEDDVISGVTWVPLSPINQQYNQVGGNFIDPNIQAAVYQAWPYPTVYDATYLAEDDGFPRRMNLDFNCIQDPVLTQKLARIALNRSRLSGQFTATFTYKAIKAQLWSCVTLTFPPLGFSTNLFRVVKIAINPIGGVDLVLQEEESAVYSGGTITSYIPRINGIGAQAGVPIPLVGLAVAQVNFVATSGTEIDCFLITWTLPDATVDEVEVYISPAGAGDWTLMGFVPGFDGGCFTPVLQPGTSYDIQCRTVSINGVFGPYSTISGFATTANAKSLRIVNQGSLAVLNIVSTSNIASNAVTQTMNAYASSGTTVGGTEVVVQTTTIVTSGGPVQIKGCCSAFSGSFVANPPTFKLYRNGTNLVAQGIVYNGIIMQTDAVGAGTYTYTLALVDATAAVTYGGFYLEAVELKR